MLLSKNRFEKLHRKISLEIVHQYFELDRLSFQIHTVRIFSDYRNALAKKIIP